MYLHVYVFKQIPALMVAQRSTVSLTLVVSALTTQMQHVKSTTVEGAMLSIMIQVATMLLTSAELSQVAVICLDT